MERLEVGLDASAAPRIGPRDGQGDFHVAPVPRFIAYWVSCPASARRIIASNLQSTIRDLQRRKARDRRGLALIEGVRLVEEALAAGVPFRGALVAPDLTRTARGTALITELGRHGVPVEEVGGDERSEEHTSELQSRGHLVCRLLLEKKNNTNQSVT